MFDKDRADEVREGLIVNQNDGGDFIEGPFYTGGPSSPVGLDLPYSTFYVQNQASGKVLIWQKVGAGVNDWRQLSAQDIPFDPTGQINFMPSDTDVHLALTRYGMSTLGDLTEAEANVSLGQETTTSNGWVSKSTFPWTTTNTKTAGEFSIRWSTSVGQTKNGRNLGLRIRWRPTGGSWAILSEVQLSVSKDDTLIMQAGFQEVTLPTNNTIEVDVQHGQTIDGFASIIENVSVEVRRIGD